MTVITQEHDLDGLVKSIFDLSRSTGQEVKLDLLDKVEYIIEYELWKQYKRPDGSIATDIVDWLTTMFPHGPSIPSEDNNYVITIADMRHLAADSGRKQLEGVLAKSAGREKGARTDLGYNVNQVKAKKGNSREYLLRKLQKSHPDIYDEWLEDKYDSPRSAALAAGIIKKDELKKAKTTWRKMSEDERDEFITWTQTNDAKGNTNA